MMRPSPKDVTQLLLDWSQGDKAALDQLMPLLYEELRRLAHYALQQGRWGSTLQTTALVHEAYVRLVDRRRVSWHDRAHFLGIAAQVMRSIVIEHARRHSAAKRGGGVPKLSLDGGIDLAEERAAEVMAVDDALTSLAAFDLRKSRIVELRFFGGLTIEETTEVVGVASATVKREWRLAKAWLHRELAK